MFRNIQLVIYDLDGVLIDSNRAIIQSFQMLYDELWLQFNPDDVLCRIGHSLHQIFLDIMPEE